MNKNKIASLLFILGIVLLFVTFVSANMSQAGDGLYIISLLGSILLCAAPLLIIGDPLKKSIGFLTRVIFSLTWLAVFFPVFFFLLIRISDYFNLLSKPDYNGNLFANVDPLLVSTLSILFFVPIAMGGAIVGYLIEKFWYQRKY
jgi:ABC-type cobalt transport system substrate-binding protein